MAHGKKTAGIGAAENGKAAGYAISREYYE